MAGSLLLAVNEFCLVLGVFAKLFFKAGCNSFSLFLLVEGKSSVFLVFDVEFLLSPETSSKNHSYCFQFPSDDFPIFVHLPLSLFMTSLRSLRRLFFVVLLVIFSIFSRISCCCLDGRAISSFTWKRCFGFFPRTVSAVSFIAWAISFHLLSLMFGRLRNFTSSSFLH